MSLTLDEMFSRNKCWAESKRSADPEFFQKLSDGQSPLVFWIGCSDSRVIPTEFFNLSLGEVFVHANVANQFNPDNAGTMSAFEYAVNHLKVKHIVICGHTGCGGVQAAMSGPEKFSAPIKEWITPIAQLYQESQPQLPQDNPTEEQKMMCILNVKRQVEKVCQLGLIQNLWKKGEGPDVHGWLFSLENGCVEKIAHRSC